MDYYTSELGRENKGTLFQKIPNLNINKPEEFITYFNSNILVRGNIRNQDSFQFITYNQIGFPDSYKRGYYGDSYIIYDEDNNNNIFYTFRHWDSLGVLDNSGKLETYSIPKKFSTECDPIPPEKRGHLTFSIQYNVSYTSNKQILQFKDNILLIQQLAVPEYIKEDGTFANIFDCQFRIIIFNKKNRIFEEPSYLLPDSSIGVSAPPTTSFYFR